MPSPLAFLRQTRQPTPSQFLAAHPGCWIQYYDDTPTKDPAKALSARAFDLAVARRKQVEKCAVCFSLQAFGAARTKEGLLCFRNMGVDVDLIPAARRGILSTAEVDRQKDEYLSRRLLPFPLTPHWLVETKHGFHAIFRIHPQRTPKGVSDAMTLNGRLVRALGGDENAALLIQVLRVPGTLQFKDPKHPFLCRLLLDNSQAIAPYGLDAVRGVLDPWDVFHGGRGTEAKAGEREASGEQPFRSHDGLRSVPEGRRNCAAASLVGGILGRLPEYLWETAGWGGLEEWNRRNAVPLPERELRSVFESIARRERAGRRQGVRCTCGDFGARVVVRVDVHVGTGRQTNTCPGESDGDGPRKASVPPPHESC